MGKRTLVANKKAVAVRVFAAAQIGVKAIVIRNRDLGQRPACSRGRQRDAAQLRVERRANMLPSQEVDPCAVRSGKIGNLNFDTDLALPVQIEAARRLVP